MTKCTRDHYKECDCLYNEYLKTSRFEIKTANEMLEKIEKDLWNGDSWKQHVYYYYSRLERIITQLKDRNKDNQLVLARNNETSLIRFQERNDSLQSLVRAGERELTTKNDQIREKDKQITTRDTQITTFQADLRKKEVELTLSKDEAKRITDLFNNLQIESNNKDNEIKTKDEKIISLRVKLGEAEEDILSRELVSKERKLDELTRNLTIEPERVKNLREANERLIRAREDYNRENVATAQNDIDTIKQELLRANINLDNLYKVYRNCEKIAELRIKLEKIHEQRFEARQEVPNNH